MGVRAKDLLQPPAKARLIFEVQLGIRLSIFRAGPLVEHEHGFAMQPVSGPVGSDIAAVAPDRANLHAAERLPDVLPIGDLLGIDDQLSVRRFDANRQRRISW